MASRLVARPLPCCAAPACLCRADLRAAAEVLAGETDARGAGRWYGAQVQDLVAWVREKGIP